MKVAVEGCCHGELDAIYSTLEQLEKAQNTKVDLLLICGDFQAVRNEQDLESMAVPRKYRHMQTFYKYYSGEKKAPVLTIFIGGNHEAANHLWELPYGGWVAPNIYYLGFAGVIWFGGLRIGGLSGIFKKHDYMKGHFENPPFTESTVRSFYHVREVDVFRCKQISQPVDIFLSHDWPTGISRHGNVDDLLRKKSFLREEIESNTLGSPPAAEVLDCLRPHYWFSAHLHVKFSAVVRHANVGEKWQPAATKFLALDKCLPHRKFLQVVDFPDVTGEKQLSFDREWLAILRKTSSMDSSSPRYSCMPTTDLWQYQPDERDLQAVQEAFSADMKVPENFEKTVPAYDPCHRVHPAAVAPGANSQTILFCEKLGISTKHRGGHLTLPSRSAAAVVHVRNEDEITLDSDGDDDNGDGAQSSRPTDCSPDKALHNDEIPLDDEDGDGVEDLGTAAQSTPNASVTQALISPETNRSETAVASPGKDVAPDEVSASEESYLAAFAESTEGSTTRRTGTLRLKRRNQAIYTNESSDDDSEPDPKRGSENSSA